MFRGKTCTYCDQKVPAFSVCSCHVKIEVRGHPYTVYETLARLQRLFEVIRVAEDQASTVNRTGEVNVLVVIKNPQPDDDIPNVFKEADWD